MQPSPSAGRCEGERSSVCPGSPPLGPGTPSLCPRRTLGLSCRLPLGTEAHRDGQTGRLARGLGSAGTAGPRLCPVFGPSLDSMGTLGTAESPAPPRPRRKSASHPNLGFLVRERATVESNRWGDFVEIVKHFKYNVKEEK